MTKETQKPRRHLIILGLIFVLIILIAGHYFFDRKANVEKTNYNIELKYNSDSESYDNNNSEELNESVSKSGLVDHLNDNYFSIDGNGSVFFNIHSIKTWETNQNGIITIEGGRATLQGNVSILNEHSIFVSNLSAISGYYDASINDGASGVFRLLPNGDLRGSLSAGTQSKNVTFKIK